MTESEEKIFSFRIEEAVTFKNFINLIINNKSKECGIQLTKKRIQISSIAGINYVWSQIYPKRLVSFNLNLEPDQEYYGIKVVCKKFADALKILEASDKLEIYLIKNILYISPIRSKDTLYNIDFVHCERMDRIEFDTSTFKERITTLVPNKEFSRVCGKSSSNKSVYLILHGNVSNEYILFQDQRAEKTTSSLGKCGTGDSKETDMSKLSVEDNSISIALPREVMTQLSRIYNVTNKTAFLKFQFVSLEDSSTLLRLRTPMGVNYYGKIQLVIGSAIKV